MIRTSIEEEKTLTDKVADLIISQAEHYISQNVGNCVELQKDELSDVMFEEIADKLFERETDNGIWHTTQYDDCIILASLELNEDNYNETIPYSLYEVIYETATADTDYIK